jgi:hypothetical protein
MMSVWMDQAAVGVDVQPGLVKGIGQVEIVFLHGEEAWVAPADRIQRIAGKQQRLGARQGFVFHIGDDARKRVLRRRLPAGNKEEQPQGRK